MKIFIDKPELIGITGPINSGKRGYIDYVASRVYCVTQISLSTAAAHNALHVFGHRIDPENKSEIREYMNTMRKLRGKQYFVEILNLKDFVNSTAVFVRSLKTVEEVRLFQKLGGTVVGITADPEVRYQRSQREAPFAGFDFDYFKAVEEKDFPELDACYAAANIKIENNEVDFKKSPSQFFLGPCNQMLDRISTKFPYYDPDSKSYDPELVDKVDSAGKRAEPVVQVKEEKITV